MSPKGEQDLVKQIQDLRADLNRANNRTGAELVNLTQELFLLRKVLEMFLPPAAREELARFQRVAPPPAPDLEHQAQVQARVTAEQQAEIDRALLNNDLNLGVHGIPSLNGGR